jgi:sugar phosphate isomerase/epimerase
MNLGISTLFRLSEPLEDAVEKIKSLDIHYIELTDDGLHALSPRRVAMLKELGDSYGWSFSVHAPFSDVNIAAYDESLWEASLLRLERSIEYTADLEAEIWVFHPGAFTALERFYPGNSWKTNLRSVERLCRSAEDLGVTAAIENVPEPFPFLLKSVDDFERFYSEFNGKLGMVLDVAHANIRGETELFLERLGEKIVHIHVSDNRADQDTHLQIGLGTVKWTETIKALKRIGFGGTVIVESNEGVEESLVTLKRLIG